MFVMQKQELLVELQAAEALQQGSPASTLSSSSSSSSGQSNGQNDVESIVNDEIQARIEALGLSMAVLTTFVRLLELKLIQMEGEEGTGGHCYIVITLHFCFVTLRQSALQTLQQADLHCRVFASVCSRCLLAHNGLAF